MQQGHQVISKFTLQWRFLRALEVLCYSVAIAVSVYLITNQVGLSIAGFLVTMAVALWFIKPWKPNTEASCAFLNDKLEHLEYSTALLLQPRKDLHGLAKLQQFKINEIIIKRIKSITPPHQIGKSVVFGLMLIVLGWLISIIVPTLIRQQPNPLPAQETIVFEAIDSLDNSFIAPKIKDQEVIISFPKYTNTGRRSSTSMNINVLEGAMIQWNLTFTASVDSVFIESNTSSHKMSASNNTFSKVQKAMNSGIYSFKFYDSAGNEYTSDLYTLKVFADEAPEVAISDLDQFTAFEYFENKQIPLNASITDDFGVQDAYIIATVSKGSGESVKFREERLAFSTPMKRGEKEVNLSRNIDLDALDMTPGDELYFYVETYDQKVPKPNIARSETYFAVIKDTTSYEFSLEGTLGVDRMPDYFRSQRQLIIDTEKLIKEKPNLAEKDFKFTSNALGYDQKMLRMKYAEFMGEETESGIVIEEDLEALEGEEDHDDHDHEDEEEDPLAAYTHDHDHENEHNLVDETTKKENPADELLEAYQHNHEDPESATLFEESLKTKLRKALSNMWDAELYLRLYEPDKSLPYQYKALRYIQDIKNHARIYVHRIGFDPPPIKEEKRLTGKLEEVINYSKRATIALEDDYKYTKEAISLLLAHVNAKTFVNADDQFVLNQAGGEIANLAIQFPGRYLQTLQQLKRLSVSDTKDVEHYENLIKGLLAALPKPKDQPHLKDTYHDELDRLLLKELTND